jgi:hypothetical protein
LQAAFAFWVACPRQKAILEMGLRLFSHVLLCCWNGALL